MTALLARAAAGLMLVAAVPASGAMHTRLTKAEPGVGQTVVEAPKQVRLWFSEAPELALTSMSLLKADSTVVAKLKVAATDEHLSVSGPIPSALAPGGYLVSWRTASADGHVAKGQYAFTYKPK